MAKKNNKTFVYIGAAALIYYFLFKKKTNTPNKSNIINKRKHFEQTQKLTPIISQNEYFKDQYRQSLNACSY